MVEILFYIINLILIVVILDMILHKPITKFLEERNARIKNDIETTEQARNEAQKIRDELQERLKKAEQEAQQIAQTTREKAVLDSKQIVDNARAEAETIVTQARQQMEQERKRAIAGMQDDLAQAALQLAEKILEREVKQEDNQAIIDAFFQKVG